MKSSAGIILIRREGATLQILLGHMGGPFWTRKDQHAWTIPKGEFDLDNEIPEDAARREFLEETGMEIREELIALTPFTKNNKRHYFFFLEKNVDPDQLFSNSFELEWPPKSGKLSAFPEIDRFAWFDLSEAEEKLVKGQAPVFKLVLSHL
ncbi:MAG: NUDIX domain-containing protein [Saprospiraceae bacterium]|nr:NUDIX domain-containing protein [Saprospiraceae bacterium]